MYEIMDWIIEFRETKKELYLEKILKQVEVFILKTAKKVDPLYREDVIQELRIGTVDIVKKIKINFNQVEYFYFNKFNFKKLNRSGFSFDSIKSIFTIPYFSSFIHEVGIDALKKAFFSKNDYLVLNNLFMKFNAQNQFISILQKRYSSIIASFYRKNANYIAYEMKILNRKDENGKERLEEIEAPIVHPTYLLEQYGFSNEELIFLNLFIDKHFVYETSLTSYDNPR
ncbi:MAG: hypothetical protein K2I77_00270 [Anaeroplasmataceae bacterium]|nr:hypothetical protein [Anaeroplasmataceae bacterium]